MDRDIFVVAEQRDGKLMKISLELLGKARLLAKEGQRVTAVVMGDNMLDEAVKLADYGADRIIAAMHPLLSEYMTEPYTKTLTDLIRRNEPEIVLFGATAVGRDLAPRVSARIHTGLTADCTGLEIDEETGLLLMTRPAFGGNIMATIVCENHRPQMATVRPGVMQAVKREHTEAADIESFTPDLEPDHAIELCEVVKTAYQGKDITEADILVAGGRGIGNAGGFEPLQLLANALGGEIAASRACVDSGWCNKERQVGQTGKTVRPKLYFACGISGAIQHTAGMDASDIIIAVNKDERAPIFDIADLGIVGDVKQIIPALTEALSAYWARQSEF